MRVTYLSSMMNPSKSWFPLFYTLFFSFIIGILLYYYYSTQDRRILYVRSIDESILIEQALDSIPICTPYDRARQRTLLTTLQAWSRLAREQNIQYWLGFGSLVGYVQRRGLLPHDLDVDILIMGSHTSQLVPLINSSSSKFDTDKYILKVQPQWSIVGSYNRSYFNSIGINFVQPNARFVDRKTQLHVDIFPVYDYHPLQEKNSINNDRIMLTDYDLSSNWRSLPRNWTFPLRPCYFSTLKVWCPAQPEQVVAANYGKVSISLSNKVCINGIWTDSKDYKIAKAINHS